MDPTIIALFSIALMIALVLFGVHIGISLLLSGIIGILLIEGAHVLLAQLGTISYNSTASYGYTVIPLFILMGQFAAESGIGEDTFECAKAWIGRLRGSLGMATLLGCGAFGAASGSTASTAALFTKIAYPEMIKVGYSRSLAAGSIAAGGTIASMIPPSILLVVYGIIADVPIGQLLIAGILPGLLELASFIGVIYLIGKFHPESVPKSGQNATWKDRIVTLRNIIPIGAIFLIAIGGIFVGMFTPTEGGAMGAGGALIVVLLMRRLSYRKFMNSLKDTAVVTAMMFIAIVGGFVFSRMLVFGGTVSSVTNYLVSLPISGDLTFWLIIIMLIVLGMVMQPVVLMLITVPLLLPTIENLGFNAVWFGVIFVRISELAVITPPVAVNLYVVKGVIGKEIKLQEIFTGTIPFILADLVNLVLGFFFPQIALWLPSKMG